MWGAWLGDGNKYAGDDTENGLLPDSDFPLQGGKGLTERRSEPLIG